jgi:DnaJ-class molecular chaperone
MPTVQFKDYYQTLGIGRSATPDEVKAAYKRLARKFHPDLNPGDRAAEERFKEVNEAHEVLADPDKRKLYDRYGDAWRQYKDAGFTGDEPVGRPGGRVSDVDFGEWFARQPGSSRRSRTANGHTTTFTFETGTGGTSDSGGFSDFFQTLFGNLGGLGSREQQRAARPARGRTRGEDREVDIDVSFDEAFRGATRMLEVQTGETCSTCHGIGLVRESLCPTCDGTGQISKTRSIEVKIPAGVETGSKVRVKGQGAPGEGGGPRGDVVLRLKVKPDPRFEREGNDLRVDVDVPLYTAILGGEVIVPTPDGRVALTIPPESRNGRVFRLRNKGMARLKGKAGASDGAGERGDLLARLRIVLPTGLDEDERALFTQLRDRRAAKST